MEWKKHIQYRGSRMNIQAINLAVIEERVSQYLHEHELPVNNFEFSCHHDTITNGIVISLARKIAMEKLDTVEIKYPKDWFQAVKERFYPNWLLKRYPVLYRTILVGADAFYDKISLPEHSPSIRLYRKEWEEFL